jgi:hypothetical protein
MNNVSAVNIKNFDIELLSLSNNNLNVKYNNKLLLLKLYNVKFSDKIIKSNGKLYFNLIINKYANVFNDTDDFIINMYDDIEFTYNYNHTVKQSSIYKNEYNLLVQSNDNMSIYNQYGQLNNDYDIISNVERNTECNIVLYVDNIDNKLNIKVMQIKLNVNEYNFNECIFND